MAHFAKLSDDNVVLSVEVVNDSDCLDENNNESEAVGIAHQKTVHGWELWKQCSYNTNEGQHSLGGTPFRKNHAGIGHTYDEDRDAFIPPKPTQYSSWVSNETTCQWEAPVARPEDDQDYIWNETTKQWDLINE